MTHQLKIHTEYFRDIMLGLKKFEVRKNDRNYQERDILILNEFEPITGKYTGNVAVRKVDYILQGVDGLTPEYAVLQISKLL